MDACRAEPHRRSPGKGIFAIIAAHRAGIDLDFDRGAAIDLAGRDLLDAVRTSVSPKVIDCPEPQPGGKTEPQPGGKTTLNAVAKNGVELRIRVRVTVRTKFQTRQGTVPAVLKLWRQTAPVAKPEER